MLHNSTETCNKGSVKQNILSQQYTQSYRPALITSYTFIFPNIVVQSQMSHYNSGIL